MKHFKTRVLLPGLTIVFCVAASLIDQSAAPSQNTPPKTSAREEAYRANNIGVAVSPVTGQSVGLHLDYPGSGGFGG